MPEPAAGPDIGALFQAFVDGDEEALQVGVARHAAAIGAAADALTRVPEPLRDDERAARAWVQFVVAVGQLLAERGDDRLISRLMAPEDNPIAGWQEALDLAQRLREDGRTDESAAAVDDLLSELRTARGSAVDALLGPALGVAAANAFDRGDWDLALRLSDEALRACERAGDEQGVAVYGQNLATVVAASPAAGEARELRRRIARAQRLHDAGRLAEARELAEAVVEQLAAAGEAGATYAAKAHGLLGMIMHRLGDAAGALDHTQRALDAGRERGDEAAVVIYGANLEVIARAG